MQGDPPQTGPPEQAAELIGVPLGVNGSPGLVGDHVLAAPVPVQLGDCSRIPGLLTWAYSAGGVVTLAGKLPTTNP